MTWWVVTVTCEAPDDEDEDDVLAEVLGSLEDIRDQGYNLEWDTKEDG